MTEALIFPNNLPLACLDKRYFRFVATLPASFQRLACNPQLFTGKEAAQPFQSLRELHPLITSIPWLFADAFPAVSEAALLDIGEAGMYLSLAMLIQDYDLDGQLPTDVRIRLLQQRLHTTALLKFQRLFSQQADFWSCFEQYLSQYQQALVDEQTHHHQVSAYSTESMLAIGSGKVALFKAITTALALKGHRTDCIPQLNTALDRLTAALQLGDDIEDWADDYQAQNYTFPLTQVIPPSQWPHPTLSTAEIKDRFQKTVILERLLQQVQTWFQQALDATAGLSCSQWVTLVEHCLNLSQNYHRALLAQKLIHLININKPGNR